MAKPVEIPMPRHAEFTAKAHGWLVHRHSLLPGAHCTPAAEQRNDIRSHVRGKYGELAFLRWLRGQGLRPSHQPFRHDYTRRCPEDDFVVNGHRVEVKTKRRGTSSPWPPPEHYGVNLGVSGLDGAAYVFLEIAPGVGPGDLGPPCALLGWADKALIRERGRRIEPGATSANGNFTYQRHDWDIPVGGLEPAATLLDVLRAAA